MLFPHNYMHWPSVILHHAYRRYLLSIQSNSIQLNSNLFAKILPNKKSKIDVIQFTITQNQRRLICTIANKTNKSLTLKTNRKAEVSVCGHVVCQDKQLFFHLFHSLFKHLLHVIAVLLNWIGANKYTPHTHNLSCLYIHAP